jgi:monoamine oxidase
MFDSCPTLLRGGLHDLHDQPLQFRFGEGLLEHAYYHDWQNDPFSRGAYSYGKVDGDGMEEALAKPIENTLFFAGEATDTGGHNGTVHGAIASGHRAAAEICHSFPPVP